ncbi:MAG: hypothetical protein QXF61_07545 [Nitrososphaeria archaeon]
MEYDKFEGDMESIHILDDKLVVTVSFPDPSLANMFSNEWIIVFTRDDIKDVKRNSKTLTLLTQDNKKINISLYNVEEAYAKVKRWMEK